MKYINENSLGACTKKSLMICPEHVMEGKREPECEKRIIINKTLSPSTCKLRYNYEPMRGVRRLRNSNTWLINGNEETTAIKIFSGKETSMTLEETLLIQIPKKCEVHWGKYKFQGDDVAITNDLLLVPEISREISDYGKGEDETLDKGEAWQIIRQLRQEEIRDVDRIRKQIVAAVLITGTMTATIILITALMEGSDQ